MPLGARKAAHPNPLSGKTDTRPCANCGKPVTRYLTPKNQDKPWACSVPCKAAAQTRRLQAAGTWVQPRKPRRGDTIPCEACGKPFYRQPAYIQRNRRYCSTACGYQGITKAPVVKPCGYCGAEMRLRPSAAARNYCSKTHESLAKIKRPTGEMHNGRPIIINSMGYRTVYEPTHPAASKHNGRVLEHRLIVERHLGRYLTTTEQVDHINQDKTDNRIENLQVLDPTTHTRKTAADRVRKEQQALTRISELEAEIARLKASI